MLTELFSLQWSQPGLLIKAWLLTYALHSTLLLLGAWAVTSLLKNGAHAAKEVVWKLAVVGGLVTASFQLCFDFEPVAGRLDASGLIGTQTGVMLAENDLRDENDFSTAYTVTPIALDRAEGVSDAADLYALSEEELSRAARRREDGSTTSAAPDRAECRGEKTPRSSIEGPWRIGRGEANPEFGVSDRKRRALSEERVTVTSVYGSSAFDLENRGTEASLARTNELDERTPLAAGSLENEEAPFAWGKFLFGLWLLGVILYLYRLASARMRLSAKLQKRRLVEDGPLYETLDELRAKAGLRRAVKLSISPWILGPIALGDREICIPERAVRELTPTQQEAMLAHELAHIVRRDSHWLIFLGLIEAFFFFQPLLRLARRRIQESAEFLCDDWAVERTGRSLELAKCLAEVASWIRKEPGPALAAGMAAHGSPFVRRIDRVLEDAGRSRRRLPLTLRATMAGLLLVGIIGAAPGISIVPAPPEAPDPADHPAAVGLVAMVDGEVVPVPGVTRPAVLSAPSSEVPAAPLSPTNDAECDGDRTQILLVMGDDDDPSGRPFAIVREETSMPVAVEPHAFIQVDTELASRAEAHAIVPGVFDIDLPVHEHLEVDLHRVHGSVDIEGAVELVPGVEGVPSHRVKLTPRIRVTPKIRIRDGQRRLQIARKVDGSVVYAGKGGRTFLLWPGRKEAPVATVDCEKEATAGPITPIAPNATYLSTGAAETMNRYGYAYELAHETQSVEGRLVMGVGLGRVSDALAAQLGIDPDEVILITDIYHDMPADKAGLERYDIITHIDGDSPATDRALRRAIRNREAGDELEITVLRKGQPVQTTVTLEEIDWDTYKHEWPEWEGEGYRELLRHYYSDEENRHRIEEALRAYQEALKEYQEDVRREIEPQLLKLEEQLQRRFDELQPKLESLYDLRAENREEYDQYRELYEAELERLTERLSLLEEEMQEIMEPELDALEDRIREMLEQLENRMEDRLEDLERN